MQGRHRMPIEVAQAKGATVINPARFASRTEPALEENPYLTPDDVPPHFDALQTAIWREHVAKVWWVRVSDYMIVELTCVLIANIRTLPYTVKSETINTLSRLLAQQGATPVYRTKVTEELGKGTKRASGLRSRRTG